MTDKRLFYKYTEYTKIKYQKNQVAQSKKQEKLGTSRSWQNKPK